MTPEELTTLVDRARRSEDATTVPPSDLLHRAGLDRRRRRAVGLLATAASVAVVLGGVAFVTAGRHADTSAHLPGPSTTDVDPPIRTTRVGAGGITLAVPASWVTTVPTCPPNPGLEEIYVVHPAGSRVACRPTAGPGPYVVVEGLDVPKPVGHPSGLIGGSYYFVLDQTAQGETIEVREHHVRFVVRATGALGDQIERSLATEATGHQLVPMAPLQTADGPVDTTLTEYVHSYGLIPVVVEQDVAYRPGTHDLLRPGELVRTEPPVGAEVPDRSRVTIVYAAGNLDRYLDSFGLQQHGWAVRPPTDFTPPVSRARAARTAGHPGADTYLRGFRVGTRWVDAWLVGADLHATEGGNVSDVTVVDATTGEVIARATGVSAAS